jgi:RNA polymerase sigma factor (sigma-70 family)
MRVARHLSLCHDDALDAYQRALEIYLRRVDSLDPATELAWLKVVVRHEALAVRRARAEMVAAEEPDLDAHPAGEQRSVDDRIASGERSARSAEALRHLKPDEARALMLKAQGHSYQEIGRDLGWTYTKVNRSITEGRARFMKVFGRIEAGEECERFEPVLAAIVFGEAGPEQLLDIRPHLRHCARCRATIRKLHLSRRDRAAALIPLPVLVPLRWIGEKLGIGGGPDGAVQIHPDAPPRDESTLDPPADAPDPADPFGAGDAAAGAARPDVDPFGAGDAAAAAVRPDVAETLNRMDHVAAEHADRVGRLHPLQLKQDLYGIFHRVQASDVATGVQLGSGGGGRGTAIAALIGLCVSSLGAGAACVATGVLPDPVGIIGQDDRPTRHARAPKRSVQAKLANLPDPAVGATAAASNQRQRPKRHRRSRTRERARTAAQPRQTATSHEKPAVSPPTPGSTGEFSIEQRAASSSTPAPAAAPATGGSEFMP